MPMVTAALVRRMTMTDTATSPKNLGGFIYFSSGLNDYDLWAGNSSNGALRCTVPGLSELPVPLPTLPSVKAGIVLGGGCAQTS